jgi:SAM-dependent methyltransferase
MHTTAMKNGADFFETYVPQINNPSPTVVEIGSQNVNGSLRDVCPEHVDYLGLDFVPGNGVDIILEDAYKFPLPTESMDIVVSSSCFEHAQMFWLTFLEVMRILKPSGLFYLNAPSAGSFHRYPVDCWRFYPDSGVALVTWGQRNGLPCTLLESYVHVGGSWQDFVAVFLKDQSLVNQYPGRILSRKTDFENGHLFGSQDILNESNVCQNELKLVAINKLTTIEY